MRAGVFISTVVLLAGWVGAAPATPAPAVKPPVSVSPLDPIKGIEIVRPNGTFLGLEVVNNNFVLTFYDVKKKKMTADVARATMRWPVKYQPTDERTVLNPAADGMSLTSTKPVRPPHAFKVFVALFVEGSETAVENYVVDYRS